MKEQTKQMRSANTGPIYSYLSKYPSQALAGIFSSSSFSPLLFSSLAFLISLFAAGFLISGSTASVMLAGILLYLSAVLRCAAADYASSRPKTAFNDLFNAVIDILRFTLFFSALGIHFFNNLGQQLYLFAVIIYVSLGLFVTGKIGNQVAAKGQTEANPQIDEERATSHTATRKGSTWSAWLKMFFGLEQQDTAAFLAMICCLAGLTLPLFWLALAAGLFVTLGLVSAGRKNKSGFSMPDPFYFYMAGIVLICVLIYQMDLQTIAQSLKEVGWGALWAFATAALWVLVNTWALSVLMHHKVPFKTVLYVELTGNAYNNILPLAGLGGEPYKVKVLSEHVGIDRAGRAVIQNRLIHSMTGLLFTAMMVFTSLALVDLSDELFTFLLIGGCVAAVFSLSIGFVVMSSAPGKFSGYLLKRLKFLKEYKDEPLPTMTFLSAVFWQVVGRSCNLVEIYAIYVLLGFSPGFPDLVLVSTFLSITGAVFFLIPQGLGVNEASISTAFSILGYATTLGLSFGLIRRARVIVWALLGVFLHLYVMFRDRNKKPLISNTDVAESKF